MAMTVEDILARRSRMLFVDARAAIASAEPVARQMADLLGMDAEWCKEQVRGFQEMAEPYLG
jgi:glycerol-3-phosphate dehydrogenase